jgi:ADP-heptose:LPS heptosyltransferase
VRKYIFKNKWKIRLFYCIDFLGGIVFSVFRLRSDASEPRSLLVVRLDQVGDMIQALPFFIALRQKYPAARITALCAKPTTFLLERFSPVDNIITMESSWFYHERKTTLHEIIRVAKAIKETEADMAFDLRGDFRNILFLFLSGVRRIAGYGWTGGGFLLAKEFEFQKEDHEIDKNLRLIGEKSQTLIALNFGVDEQAEQDAARVFNTHSGGKTMVVHPFTRAASKMWGIGRYKELIGRIRSFSPATTIFVIGSSEERDLVREFSWEEKLIDCTGALNFAGTLSLIKKADVFIGNDSGPQYMAAYSGKKTCVIYGDTVNYLRWKPKVRDEDFIAFSKDVYCGPCESEVCLNKKEGHLCMNIITVGEVFNAVKKWL